jgi:hypothetical protein
MHDPEVREWHDRASQIHDLVYSKLTGGYERDLRTTLLIGYCQAIMQYHAAILKLWQMRTLPSPARALHRSLAEASVRCLWVFIRMSDEDIEALRNHRYAFPAFRCMVAILDSAFAADGLFAIPGEDWKGMCGFTHTGIEQITHQFDEEGYARPVYDPPAVTNAIQSATAVLVAFSIPMAHYFGKPAAAREISDAYVSAFGQETAL